MSDLQHLVPQAIDVVTEWVSEQEGTSMPLEVIGALLALTAAARRVANLDEMVKRAMRKAEQMGWPDQMDVEEVEQSVRGLIVAALGIDE